MSECQFVIKTVSSSYWEVTFNNPPINLIDPNTIPQLNALIDKIESDPTLSVVVFKSNDPDFYIAHYDISAIASFAALPTGPTGLDAWNDVLVRLSRVPALTVAAQSLAVAPWRAYRALSAAAVRSKSWLAPMTSPANSPNVTARQPRRSRCGTRHLHRSLRQARGRL
jgi:hypothetical protein